MISVKFLSRRLLTGACFSLALLSAGCDLHEFVQWAPDGQHAFVRGTDGTWLMDGSGTILGKANDARAWLPDSSHLIAVREVKPRNWDEYAGLLGTDRVDRVTDAAADFVKVVRDFRGDWSKFTESAPYKKWEKAEQISETYNGTWLDLSVFFYLRQTDPKTVAPIIEAMSVDEKAKIDDLTPSIDEIVIRSVLPSEPAADQLLLRSPDSILWVGASPNGRIIAFAAQEPGRPALYVVSREGVGHAALVDESANEAGWSTDGQYLAYAKTTAPYELLDKSIQLGTVTSRQVCAADGKLLAEFPAAKDLAGIVLGKNVTRVAYLPDGRILFAAATVRLPAITADMPSRGTLFAIPAGATQSVESVVLPKDIEGLPNRADRFVVSPDKKKVAIPGDAGQVSILFLETGKVVPMQEAKVYNDTQKYEQLAPVWRSASELTMAVPAGDPAGSSNRAEVVLANLNGQKTVISKSWANTMTKQFLPGKD